MNEEKLDLEINNAKNNVAPERLDMSFGEIISMYKDKEININPKYQRMFRWTQQQQTDFIESILLGIPLPVIFVAQGEDGKWELVDGLQRVSTVLSFFGVLEDTQMNNLKLLKGQIIEALEGYTIKTMPFRYILNIKRAVCGVGILKWNTSNDMRFELFRRLNTGGTLLSEQEIRNCIFRDESNRIYDYLERLSNNEDFIKLVDAKEDRIKELFLQELVLRFTVLFALRDDFKKDQLSVFLTESMDRIIKNEHFNYQYCENIFLRTINVLSEIDKRIFRKKRDSFVESLFDTIMLGVANNINYYEINKKEKIDVILNNKEKLINHPDFSKYISGASGTRSNVIKRINLALDIFKP